jgi:hypothetical protein
VKSWKADLNTKADSTDDLKPFNAQPMPKTYFRNSFGVFIIFLDLLATEYKKHIKPPEDLRHTQDRFDTSASVALVQARMIRKQK